MDGDSKDFKSVFNIFLKNKKYIFLDTSSCGCYFILIKMIFF